jgi:hypothetical protein
VRRALAVALVIGAAAVAVTLWLGPIGLAVVAAIGGTVGVLATIAARPTWRARYDPRSPGDLGERGLALKGLPLLGVGLRPPRH